MILLGPQFLSRVTLFYRKSTDDSNILRTPIESYDTWNKPEKAEEWRATLPRTEAVEE